MVSISRARACWFLALVSSATLACSEDDADAVGGGGSSGTSAGGQTSNAGMGGAAAGGTSVAGTSAGGTSAAGTGSGSSVTPLRTFDFAADIEGWQFVYAEPADLIAPLVVGVDAGADAAPPPPPPEGVATAVHDPAVGDPGGNLGSILLELPFSGPAQKISFEVNVGSDGAGVNLAGRALTARLKVDAGWSADPIAPAGIKLYVKTGAGSLYADSGYINVAPGSDWQAFQWANVSVPTYVDPAGAHAPTDVRQVGLEFDTGSTGVFSAATLHLDTVAY